MLILCLARLSKRGHQLRLSRLICFALIFNCLAVFAAEGGKLTWLTDLNQGIALAQKESKPLMIDFMADWCAPCKEMDHSTFNNAAVIASAKSFIAVRIDIDKQHEVAVKYNALARAYGGIGVPNMLFMKSDGKKLKHVVGYQGPEQLLSNMHYVLKLSK
jgi:thiol:disulfide interchange protein DsbD